MIWTKLETRVTIDVVVFVAVFLPSAILRAGYVRTRRLGFYCGDESIGYPVSDELLTTSRMAIIVYIFPALLFLLVEVLVLSDNRRRAVAVSLRRFSSVYLAYLYGTACYLALSMILKAITGELRPNFIATCRPDFSKLNCSQGFIVDYNCTSDATDDVIFDAATSFPSGHATASFYMVTFSILYLHKYVGPRPTKFAASIFYFLLVDLAVYVGHNRVIVERQHHWWDVVFGAIFGSIVAIYAAFAFLYETSEPPYWKLSTSDGDGDTLDDKSYGSCQRRCSTELQAAFNRSDAAENRSDDAAENNCFADHHHHRAATN